MKVYHLQELPEIIEKTIVRGKSFPMVSDILLLCVCNICSKLINSHVLMKGNSKMIWKGHVKAGAQKGRKEESERKTIDDRDLGWSLSL